MAKEQFNCRLSGEVKLLIKAEVVRLSAETGQKVTEADVVEMAVVRWCSVGGVDGGPAGDSEENEGSPEGVDRRAVAEAAMRGVEDGSAPALPVPSKVNKGTESVAQRKAREAREHAAALAESDVAARLTGRDDIDYDLENVPHRSVADPAPVRADGKPMEPIIQRPGKVYKKTWAPLARPHGGVGAKRRREQ